MNVTVGYTDKNGNLRFVVVRQMPHDAKVIVGKRLAGFGLVVSIAK